MAGDGYDGGFCYDPFPSSNGFFAGFCMEGNGMSPEEMFDPMVHNPPHYEGLNGLEAIDVIEAFAPSNYLRGNALKYLLRAGRKADAIQDLQKAMWYIEREIANQRRLEYEVKKIADRAPPVCPDLDQDLWCNAT
jgi:hypothetical protein